MILSLQWGIPPRLYAALSVIILSGIMLSCSIPDKDGNSHSAEFENVDSEDVPDNPASSLDWYRFYTNDSQDCQKAFVSKYQDSLDLTSVGILVKKEGGYGYADYGLAIHLEDGTYIALVVDIFGNYRVFESGSDGIVDIVEWSYSDALNTGYGETNTLNLVYVDNDRFSVYLNDQSAGTFDKHVELFSGWGFFAYVASENYEQLQSSPVEVYYAVK